jgi:ferrochelatase
VEEVLEELERGGHRAVLVAPIGFVSDHVEILYDIDIEFQNLATQKGMRLERIPMLNASQPLVDTLADVIHAHLQETNSLAPA